MGRSRAAPSAFLADIAMGSWLSPDRGVALVLTRLAIPEPVRPRVAIPGGIASTHRIHRPRPIIFAARGVDGRPGPQLVRARNVFGALRLAPATRTALVPE